MSNLTGRERADYVQKMFSQIAGRYDIMNRLMTLGMDRSWRIEAINKLSLQKDQVVLDLGSGTGDIAFEIKARFPDVIVVASDFTEPMLRLGQRKKDGEKVNWVIADAMHLPFADECVDGIISGYLLRNVPDLMITIQEQHRVLRPGGRFSALDTTPPQKNILRPFILFYFRYIIPTLGKIVTGHSEAYAYLPTSTEKFFTAESVAGQLKAAGFIAVSFLRRMFGTMAIHWAEKAQDNRN